MEKIVLCRSNNNCIEEKKIYQRLIIKAKNKIIVPRPYEHRIELQKRKI